MSWCKEAHAETQSSAQGSLLNDELRIAGRLLNHRGTEFGTEFGTKFASPTSWRKEAHAEDAEFGTRFAVERLAAHRGALV